jgi:hypothetical protein
MGLSFRKESQSLSDEIAGENVICRKGSPPLNGAMCGNGDVPILQKKTDISRSHMSDIGTRNLLEIYKQ